MCFPGRDARTVTRQSVTFQILCPQRTASSESIISGYISTSDFFIFMFYFIHLFIFVICLFLDPLSNFSRFYMNTFLIASYVASKFGGHIFMRSTLAMPTSVHVVQRPPATHAGLPVVLLSRDSILFFFCSYRSSRKKLWSRGVCLCFVVVVVAVVFNHICKIDQIGLFAECCRCCWCDCSTLVCCWKRQATCLSVFVNCYSETFLVSEVY